MKVILVNTSTDRMSGRYHRDLMEWARGLGLDTRLSTPKFALIHHDDGWHGHFAVKRQRDGHDYVDQTTWRVAADYDVDIRIGEPNWPVWFPDVTEVPDMPPEHLVEVLHAAAQQADDLHWRLRPELADEWGQRDAVVSE